MPDELTPAQLNELIGRDPRVQLMERLYTKPENRKVMQEMTAKEFPTAYIPEQEMRREVRGELDGLRAENEKLRERLDNDDKNRRYSAFRSTIVSEGQRRVGRTLTDEEIKAVETFMVDNQIGPKSVNLAVDRYFDGLETAEPTADQFTFPWQRPGGEQDADVQHLKRLMAAGPADDLDIINAPFVEKNFRETVAAMNGQRR